MKRITFFLLVVVALQVPNVLRAQKIGKLNKITFKDVEQLFRNKEYKNTIELANI